MRSFTIKDREGPPVGTYPARFLGVEDTSHDEYGPGVAWKFEILDGPSKGKEVSRVTSPQPTEKNTAGKMIRALTGGRLARGSTVDVDQYIGQKYTIVVAENSTGTSTRVDSVMPLPPGRGQPESARAEESGDEDPPF
jgi:hypothetical protein